MVKFSRYKIVNEGFLMKRTQIAFSLILIFLVLNSVAVPIIASTTSLSINTLPFEDPPNDVIQSDDQYTPGEGDLVDTHPEIDIKAAWIHPFDPDLVVEFYDNIIENSNYTISVVFSTASSLMFQYMIMEVLDTVMLVDIRNMMDLVFLYWNANESKWQDTPIALPYIIEGHNITFKTVGIAFPSLEKVRVGIIASYNGELPQYVYTDIAPDQSSVPGFQTVWIVFSIIVLTGLALLQRKSKFLI